MHIACSIDIHSPRAAVFRWLASPEKAMAWMTGVSKTEILHQTSEMTGTTFRETVAEDGQELEMRGVVTRYEPDRLIAFHLVSKIHTVDVEYVLTDIENGVCLIQRAGIQWKFPMNIISLLIGTTMKRNIAAQSHKELDQLKVLCEGLRPD